MIFKQATVNDAKALLTLTHTAFLRYAREVGQTVKGVSETYDDIVNDIENKYVLLAFHNDELVGAVRLENIENAVYISRLCSSPEFREINVGGMLIEKAKDIVEGDALCLHTSTKISSLVTFYYKYGFYIDSVNHEKGYPRGLFVCPLKKQTKTIDYQRITKDK